MKGNLKYILATLLMAFFFLPLAVSFVVFILTSAIPYLGFSYPLLIVATIIGLAIRSSQKPWRRRKKCS